MKEQQQGLTYCRPEHKGRGKPTKTSTKYCPDCGYKRRGENHSAGKHHIDKR